MSAPQPAGRTPPPPALRRHFSRARRPHILGPATARTWPHPPWCADTPWRTPLSLFARYCSLQLYSLVLGHAIRVIGPALGRCRPGRRTGTRACRTPPTYRPRQPCSSSRSSAALPGPAPVPAPHSTTPTHSWATDWQSTKGRVPVGREIRPRRRVAEGGRARHANSRQRCGSGGHWPPRKALTAHPTSDRRAAAEF